MNFATHFTEKVRACEVSTNYTFHNKSLCAEALNAGLGNRQLRKNDCLALYGDSAVQRALCIRWYKGGENKGMIALD